MDKSKKLPIIIVIGIVVVLIVICCFIGDKDTKTLSASTDVILENAEKEKASIQDEDTKDLESIDIDEYLEFYKGSEEKIVLIARPTCSFCQIADPIIRKINKDYDLNIYYLNTDDFTDDDESKFIKSDSFLENGYGTPMLFIVANNKIVDKVDGLTDTAHYIEFLQQNKMI